MVVLSVAVVVLAAITVLNLAVTVAVVRRLRQQALAGPQSAADPDPGGPEPGAPVPSFTARTADGRQIGDQDLTGPALVAFFSTSCPSCTQEAPLFAAAAPALAAEGVTLLSVVQRKYDRDDTRELAALLEPVGPVVVEPGPGPVLRAFEVASTPSFYSFDADGRLAGKGVRLAATRHAHEAVPAVAAAAVSVPAPGAASVSVPATEDPSASVPEVAPASEAAPASAPEIASAAAGRG